MIRTGSEPLPEDGDGRQLAAQQQPGAAEARSDLPRHSSGTQGSGEGDEEAGGRSQHTTLRISTGSGRDWGHITPSSEPRRRCGRYGVLMAV
jgi:hypothetical protein